MPFFMVLSLSSNSSSFTHTPYKYFTCNKNTENAYRKVRAYAYAKIQHVRIRTYDSDDNARELWRTVSSVVAADGAVSHVTDEGIFQPVDKEVVASSTSQTELHLNRL